MKILQPTSTACRHENVESKAAQLLDSFARISVAALSPTSSVDVSLTNSSTFASSEAIIAPSKSIVAFNAATTFEAQKAYK